MNIFKHRVFNGIFWSGIERFSVQIIQFILSVILARLLSPSDFGLIAIVLIILNILQTINETGFGAALIYKQDRDALDFSSIFILNIALGLFLYSILFITSPYVSTFFNQPQLTFLIRIIGLNLIINSFVVVQRTKLIIDVDFKTQAKASFIAVVISGIIGVYTAYIGYGVMSLVYQSITNAFINVILIWIYVKWKPTLEFSFERFIFLYKFAYKLILARLINTLFTQFYAGVIGKIYAPAQLGYYNRAQSFVTLSANNITGIVQRVSTPLLCEHQQSQEELKKILLNFITYTAALVFPILFALFVLSEPIIVTLLTDKWQDSVFMLKILSPVGLFYVISTLNRNIFNATGKTNWALKTEIIKKVIFVLIILISIHFGFTILLLSQLLIAVIEFLIDAYYVKKQIGIGAYTQIKSLKYVLLASIIMSLVIFLTTFFLQSNYLKLIIGITTGFSSYLIMGYIFNIANIRTFIDNFIKIKRTR